MIASFNIVSFAWFCVTFCESWWGRNNQLCFCGTHSAVRFFINRFMLCLTYFNSNSESSLEIVSQSGKNKCFKMWWDLQSLWLPGKLLVVKTLGLHFILCVLEKSSLGLFSFLICTRNNKSQTRSTLFYKVIKESSFTGDSWITWLKVLLFNTSLSLFRNTVWA